MKVGLPLAEGYRYLRRYGWSHRAAFKCARDMSTVIGSIGDVNPIDHSGGYIFQTEYGAVLEYISPDTGSESDGVWFIYRVDLGDSDLPDWANFETVHKYIGPEEDYDYAKEWEKGNPVTRACILEDVASYYGWHELDYDPLVLTAREVWARYGEAPDQIEWEEEAP